MTAEGLEHIRAAHLRHGLYARAEEVALRALGEEPAQFQELLKGLWETYNPTDAAQEGLVIRLARAEWRLNRADRMQEGYALRQAKDVNIGREDNSFTIRGGRSQFRDERPRESRSGRPRRPGGRYSQAAVERVFAARGGVPGSPDSGQRH